MDKYCLVSDDGDWYVVPVNRREEFYEASSLIEEYWRSVTENQIKLWDKQPEFPSYVVSVGGSPSRVVFEGFTVE